MGEEKGVEFREDRVPFDGIEEAISELVDLYGGTITASRANERDFTLPLRRGAATAGAVECTISWAPDDAATATVHLTTKRDVDASKTQRVMLLAAGVVGSLLFLLWPFYPAQREYGTLAWLGGAVAIAVYLISLRRTSGGIAADFLQRLVKRLRTV
jgi:hypothetical protein